MLHFLYIKFRANLYLRVLPPEREELPPDREPEDIVPDERETLLLDERTELEVERMVLLDEERTELEDERDGVAELFTVVRVGCVRVVVALLRVVVVVREGVATRLVVAVRVAVAAVRVVVAEAARVAVVRVAVVVLRRTLVLP